MSTSEEETKGSPYFGKSEAEELRTKLKHEEEFYYVTIPKMVEQNPEKVTLTFIDQVHDNMGEYGTYRIKYLKHLFKEFLENLIPIDSKSAVRIATCYEIPNIMDLVKGKL